MTAQATTALWNAADAAVATGGRNSIDWRANGISIDSRTIARDDLFVALQGPSFDGHDYVGRALESGAAAGLVSHAPDHLKDDSPLLMVDDTMDALNALGVAARDRRQLATSDGSCRRRGPRRPGQPAAGVRSERAVRARRRQCLGVGR